MLFKDAGKAADLAVQLLVSEDALLARLAGGGFALPDEGGFVGRRCVDVFVETIVTDIELAAGKPFRIGQLPLQDLFPGLEPDQLIGSLPRPEFFG